MQVFQATVGLWGFGIARAKVGMEWHDKFFKTEVEAAEAALGKLQGC